MKPRIFTAQTLLAAALLAACSADETVAPVNEDQLAVGTWGGDNVAFIVSDSAVHVHIGCTNGTFKGAVVLDDDGRFTMNGEYLLRAHPIAIGPPLPAQLAGIVTGSAVTFSVAVNDTTPVALGPAVAVRGRTPRMGPCPICVTF